MQRFSQVYVCFGNPIAQTSGSGFMMTGVSI